MTSRANERAAHLHTCFSLPHFLWPGALMVGLALLLVAAYWFRAHLELVESNSLWATAFSRQFDLAGENNIPTWYSSFLWEIAATLCIVLAMLEQHSTELFGTAAMWIALGCVSLFLSLDEVVSIHEEVGAFADAAGMKLSVYSWLPFGIVAAAAIALSFLHFIRKLPRDVAVMIFISGVVFVTGAIGFEAFGALVEGGTLTDFPGGWSWHRAIAVEEFLEMSGVIMFIGALYTLLRRQLGRAPLSGEAQRGNPSS